LDSSLLPKAKLGLQTAFAAAVAAGIAAGTAYWLWLRRAPPVERPVVAAPSFRAASAVLPPLVPFTDITDQAGIRFRHFSGAYGEKLLPETLGGGCAFFDFNNDGKQDILFVSGCPWPWHRYDEEALASFHGTLTLYRNEGGGRFVDCTEAAGLGGLKFYGMGAAVGDYDNDGWRDLYVTAVGPNHLFRNENGIFRDVTDETGTAGDSADWSSAAAFADVDQDGDLDLWVCQYVEWSRDLDLAQGFVLTGLGRAYGPPHSFAGTLNRLFLNQGDGTFRDASEEAGIRVRNPATGEPMAKSLGLRPCDVNGDGWIDFIVANDTVQNFLFLNRRDGTFEEVGTVTGVGFDSTGRARGAMGIDAAYYRNDPCLGIAIGNFANEMSALYVSLPGGAFFSDEAVAAGFGPLTRLDLTFGTLFMDYDLDGRLDLICANGHLEQDIHLVQESESYRQPVRVFWNAGPEQAEEFVAVGADLVGKDIFTPMVGRGLSYADIDGDGDLDVLVTQIDGPPMLLRNDLPSPRRFLRVTLRDYQGHRDAYGAVVEVETNRGTLSRDVMPTRSYLAQVELPLSFGIPEGTLIREVRIRWPDGRRQTLSSWPTQGELTVTRRAEGTKNDLPAVSQSVRGVTP